MRALSGLSTSRSSTCMMKVCGLKVLPNQNQFQKTQLNGTLWI